MTDPDERAIRRAVRCGNCGASIMWHVLPVYPPKGAPPLILCPERKHPRPGQQYIGALVDLEPGRYEADPPPAPPTLGGPVADSQPCDTRPPVVSTLRRF